MDDYQKLYDRGINVQRLKIRILYEVNLDNFGCGMSKLEKH